MIEWLRRMFRKPPEIFPKRILGVQLAKEVNRLNLQGYSHTELGPYCYRTIECVSWYRLEEITIPNMLNMGRNVDHTVVRRYSELSTISPPIVFDKYGYLLDGLHRLYAVRYKGGKTILAYLPEVMEKRGKLLW